MPLMVDSLIQWLFKFTYLDTYIHLRFKITVLGVQLSCFGCLSRTVS